LFQLLEATQRNWWIDAFPALPTTLAADQSSGSGPGVRMVFERHIVYPNGHREVEGVTPKALPVPDASHALPRPTDPTDDTNEGAV
jgi:hypothetical protein